MLSIYYQNITNLSKDLHQEAYLMQSIHSGENPNEANLHFEVHTKKGLTLKSCQGNFHHFDGEIDGQEKIYNHVSIVNKHHRDRE